MLNLFFMLLRKYPSTHLAHTFHTMTVEKQQPSRLANVIAMMADGVMSILHST